MPRFFRTIKILIVLIVSAGSFLFVNQVRAAGQCFCYTSLSTVNLPANITVKDLNDPTKFDSLCYSLTSAQCIAGSNGIDKKLNQCIFQTSDDECDAAKKRWKTDLDTEVAYRLSNRVSTANGVQKRSGLIGALLPACVFAQDVKDECADVTIFIKLAIDIANVLFTIIGSLALAVFIYGGFILILSEGSQDKIKKGTGAMMAAFVGLAIVFLAYLLIRIFGEAIGIEEGFNLLR
jgi:hypothetical protein